LIIDGNLNEKVEQVENSVKFFYIFRSNN